MNCNAEFQNFLSSANGNRDHFPLWTGVPDPSDEGGGIAIGPNQGYLGEVRLGGGLEELRGLLPVTFSQQ